MTLTINDVKDQAPSESIAQALELVPNAKLSLGHSLAFSIVVEAPEGFNVQPMDEVRCCPQALIAYAINPSIQRDNDHVTFAGSWLIEQGLPTELWDPLSGQVYKQCRAATSWEECITRLQEARL